MGDSHNERTHTAYGYRREGKKSGRLVEIGSGRLDDDRNHAHLYLDRLPLGGFSGYIYLMPKGERPPDPKLQPQRPGESGDEDSDSDE